jgi:hypothetical protein
VDVGLPDLSKTSPAELFDFVVIVAAFFCWLSVLSSFGAARRRRGFELGRVLAWLCGADRLFCVEGGIFRFVLRIGLLPFDDAAFDPLFKFSESVARSCSASSQGVWKPEALLVDFDLGRAFNSKSNMFNRPLFAIFSSLNSRRVELLMASISSAWSVNVAVLPALCNSLST